ncbi:4'-phosphopantetheinyl transferase family protein [Mucilaginibacter antarcticus]|uniref:4'-phosphopantetheinyl transferase family protein n=1 Tax=Mucilaginibacter antarcticus TaxID=1855725 RepID=A0ABW5XKC7_9SPHI
MYSLLYCYNDKQLSPALFDKYLSNIPHEMMCEIMKFRNWQDAQASLFGKLLLSHFFINDASNHTLNDVRYSNNGKPYINGSTYFNISHSGSLVVCAFSKSCEIGVDVELIKNIDIESFEYLFAADELRQIKSSDDELNLFYTFWTIKEAASKAEGQGLSMQLKNVVVIDDHVLIENKKWSYKNIDIDLRYKIHIVAKEPLDSVSLQCVVFTDTLLSKFDNL